ncbi:hypothetical protein, partial [Stenotrophomonas sp. HMWF003]|uniref:hypothetical protein n=1 Tax=Stenotrophomonas sp. HMWF003 TaxID=2056840 RepID=UPI001C627222
LDSGLVAMGNATANVSDLLGHPVTSAEFRLFFEAMDLQHLFGLTERCAVALSVRNRNVSRVGAW